jgi:hypothetical protein
MKLKDMLLNILIGFGVFSFIVLVGALEVVPFWVGLIVALLLWLTYILIVVRDNVRESRIQPVMWVKVAGHWRTIDKYGQLVPMEKTPSPPFNDKLYDQEEDKR